MDITQPSHLNTGLFSQVFRCHLNTRPFENRTTFDHLTPGESGIQMVTVYSMELTVKWNCAA